MDWGKCVSKEGVATLNCLPIVFKNVVEAALIFCGTVALAFVIWSGVQLIRSSGDPKQVQGAKQTLTYAIIGLIIVLLSFFVVNLISVITGVTCIQTFGFDTCK